MNAYSGVMHVLHICIFKKLKINLHNFMVFLWFILYFSLQWAVILSKQPLQTLNFPFTELSSSIVRGKFCFGEVFAAKPNTKLYKGSPRT